MLGRHDALDARPDPSRRRRRRSPRSAKSAAISGACPSPPSTTAQPPGATSRGASAAMMRYAASPSAPPSSASLGSWAATSGISPSTVAALDVGRVGHQQVERPAQPLGPAGLPPVAGREARARRHAQRFGIGLGDGERRVRGIDADAARLRIFPQQGEQQAARSQAQVEDAQRPACGPAAGRAPSRSPSRCRAAARAPPARP